MVGKPMHGPAGFDDNDAKVACKQLGYKNGAFAGTERIAAPLTPTLLDNVMCKGTEARLIDCPAGDIDNYSRFDTVSVACSNWGKSAPRTRLMMWSHTH
jgi:Scavenger receptor cysteine-rich domain